MDIQVSQAQGRVPVTVFHLDGDLSVDSYELLQSKAEQAIQAGSSYLLLDMSNVPFMSSAGIRALNQIYVWLMKMPKDEGAPVRTGSAADFSARLKLLKPGSTVQRALSVAGMDIFLEVHTDLKNAVDSF